MTPCISMTERPPTRHERDLAAEGAEIAVNTASDAGASRDSVVLSPEERRELDRGRKQRERGTEPPLPQMAPWWEPADRKRTEVLSSPELLRGLLEADLEAGGCTLESALATMKRGRIPREEHELHDTLVRAVAALHERGAELKDIAAAIGKDRKTVEQLVAQGQEQRHACKRHDTFQSDCLACLANAPDRAPSYTGPEGLRGRVVGGS
jgi:hypothetical protein